MLVIMKGQCSDGPSTKIAPHNLACGAKLIATKGPRMADFRG